MKMLSNTEAELKKSVAYKKKGVLVYQPKLSQIKTSTFPRVQFSDKGYLC